MMDQNELKKWLASECPLTWSLLNKQAQKNLPSGLIEYIGTGTISKIEDGKHNVKKIEKYLIDLKRLCGLKAVGDTYRRDFSGVNSEKQLAELFCEIALCTSLGNLSSKLQLRPSTGKGTYSDALFNLHGFNIFAEAKRYDDPWPHIDKPGDDPQKLIPYSRSIVQKPLGTERHDSARPRSMELRSKLRDVHKQFQEGKLNILFVFHSSFAETIRYLTQTFFGDSNFFNNDQQFVLEPDGLFYLEEWQNISACCLARIYAGSDIIFPFIWKNPRALLQIPRPVLETLGRHNQDSAEFGERHT